MGVLLSMVFVSWVLMDSVLQIMFTKSFNEIEKVRMHNLPFRHTLGRMPNND